MLSVSSVSSVVSVVSVDSVVSTGEVPARFLAAGALIPVTWLFLTALVLFALPWSVGFVRLVIDSLR